MPKDEIDELLAARERAGEQSFRHAERESQARLQSSQIQIEEISRKYALERRRLATLREKLMPLIVKRSALEKIRLNLTLNLESKDRQGFISDNERILHVEELLQTAYPGFRNRRVRKAVSQDLRRSYLSFTMHERDLVRFIIQAEPKGSFSLRKERFLPQNNGVGHADGPCIWWPDEPKEIELSLDEIELFLKERIADHILNIKKVMAETAISTAQIAGLLVVLTLYFTQCADGAEARAAGPDFDATAVTDVAAPGGPALL